MQASILPKDYHEMSRRRVRPQYRTSRNEKSCSHVCEGSDRRCISSMVGMKYVSDQLLSLIPRKSDVDEKQLPLTMSGGNQIDS